MKIKFLLIASIFMTSSVYSQEKWSLKKCVDYALENNISIKQSALSISLSERDVAITQGNFLPTIGASSSGGINSGLSPDQTGVLKNTTNFNGRFNLGVNGTIFNGFRNLNSYKQAQLGIESSKLDLEKAQNDVSLFVVNGYLNILFAKENLSVAKVQAEISKKQVEAASQRFERF
jgi:outer membrane protein